MTKSLGPLRHIAIFVRERESGGFLWVLTERGDDGVWADLDSDQSPSTTYHQAMAQGLLALQSLIVDLEVGPRDTVEEPSKPSAPTSHRFFGFGAVQE